MTGRSGESGGGDGDMREEVEMRGQGEAGEMGEGAGGRSSAGEQGGWKTERQMGEMGVGQNGRQGRDRTERKRVRW